MTRTSQNRGISLRLVHIFVICVLIISSTNSVHSEEKIDKSTEPPQMNFSVMSDIHIQETDKIAQIHFLKALRDHRIINPNSSSLIINGDLTDGKAKDYKLLERLLKKVPHPPVLAAIGNHEYYQMWKYENSTLQPNSNWTSRKAKELFQSHFGYEKPYHHQWMSGYHFIFLGSEHYRDLDESVLEDAFLSQNQLNWLAKRLEEKPTASSTKSQKPIFVFLHQPLAHSLEGSEYSRGVIQHKELRQLLRKYPNVILFSSHTHFDLEDTKQLLFDDFFIVGTGSIRKVRDKKSHPVFKSESLVVDIYLNRIVIKKREHISKRWIYPHEVIYF